MNPQGRNMARFCQRSFVSKAPPLDLPVTKLFPGPGKLTQLLPSPSVGPSVDYTKFSWKFWAKAINPSIGKSTNSWTSLRDPPFPEHKFHQSPNMEKNHLSLCSPKHMTWKPISSHPGNLCPQETLYKPCSLSSSLLSASGSRGQPSQDWFLLSLDPPINLFLDICCLV